MKVELDKKALFALASDTRVEILRALQPMRRTVSQLAEAIGIDKAAVHRHLKKLMEGGLVKRYDDHGFVYYGLSWKARDLLNPDDNTRIIILLSVSVALLLAGVTVLATALFFYGAPSSFESGTEPSTDTVLLGEGPLGAEVSSLLAFVPGSALLVVAASLLILAWRMYRKPKQESASS
jgi:DNA-binding transcriptional ArsR family regulator